MKTAAYLDWLSVTFPAAYQQEIAEAYVGKFKLVGSGSHGYAERWTTRIGAVLLANGTKQQGKNLTLPGMALQAIRDVAGSDDAILRMVRLNAGRASRVDLALNLFESTLKIADFWGTIQNGDIVTQTRSFKAVQSPENEQETLYVGSRQSDRFLRIYNKALEQGIDGIAWLRLELQCRRLVARSYVERMSTMSDIRPFINRAIDGFASFPTLAEYRAAVQDDDAEVPLQTKSQPAFWRWIASQVVPALVTRQIEYPEEDVLLSVTKLFLAQQHTRGRGSKPSDPMLDTE